MSELRQLSEIKQHHQRCFALRESVLKPWSVIMNGIIKGDQAMAQRYTPDIRDSIERWISTASGTVRTLGWMSGKESFHEALPALHPDFVNGLRLPWWTEEYSKPHGPIPEELNNQIYPTRRLQKREHIHFVHRHAVGIHSHIFNINKLHPGKWHPEFQGRTINTLLFYDGSIRATGWALKKIGEGEAFYAFVDQVVDQLKKALEARKPLDTGILPVRGTLPAFDHKRSDFNQ